MTLVGYFGLPLDAPAFVLVELCVFCAIRGEGDKGKQYSHCWSGSPHISSFSSPRACSSTLTCVFTFICTYFCLYVLMYPISYMGQIMQCKMLHKFLSAFMLGAACQSDIIAVCLPRDISLYAPKYPVFT